MKKIACFTLAALAFMACQREVDNLQEHSVPTYTVTITARLAETRTAYDDAGKFSWAAGDKINVLISDGTTSKQVAFTTAEAGPEVQFTGEVDEGFKVAGEAAYALDFDAAKKAWILPEQMTVNPLSPLSGIPLFGTQDLGGLFQFKTATGILKFTVENIPVETAAVTLETVGDEAPALCGELAAAPANGVVTMAALANGGRKLVSAGTPDAPNTTMDYYFFVPAGTLPAEKTQFNVVDGSDNVIKSLAFKKAVEVAANRITNVAPVHFEAVKESSRQVDSLALVAIYNASDGANWTKNKWELDKPIDTWPAVTVTDGRVTALKLTTSGVIAQDWTLPEAVGDLAELTELRINSNKLVGNLPESLFELSKLEKLYLQNNNLTGSLSGKIGQLTELTELYVDRNANMTGGIPPEIGNLKKLARLNVSQSGIGGEIPVELGQCESMLQFMAFKTNLSGTLPDIWDMPVLQTVMLHTNPGLTGPLPASLGKLKSLENGTAPSIQIYACNITGTIPASFAGLPEKTKQVYVNDNKMSGVIPAAVAAHPNFASWRYSPQQEGYELTVAPEPSRQLDSLALVAIYNASDGANWAKNQWELDKPIDTWPAVTVTDNRVTALKLSTSGVITRDWTLPEAVGDLTELTDLRINGNKLTGVIPDAVYSLAKLQKLYLQNNDLTGSLSPKLGQLTELTELYIDRNKNFGGTIPAEIGALTKLTGINISQTAIGGAIPQALTGCKALKNFMAYSTQLSGEIPDFWDQLPNIGVLQLYSNPGLTGPIPATIGTLKAATGIQLKECNLTGNIPASFAGLDKCGNLQLNGNKLSGVVPAEVQAHPKWQATSGWKYETNILPQQEGYGLTLE
jgi:Leucine-rich repeat (LRR) protein